MIESTPTNALPAEQDESRSAIPWQNALDLMDMLRHPVLVLDGDLRILSANRAFYTTFRVAPQQTTGRFIRDLGNGQWDIPRLRQLLEEILPQRTTVEDYQVEYTFESLGRRIMLLNARRLANVQDRFERILLAIEDITERKHTEETMARVTAIVTFSSDAIISKTLDGEIRTWNGAAERLFGYTAEEAIGRHISLIIPPDRLPEEDDILARIRAGDRIEHFDTVRRCRDGRLIEVSLAIAPLKDEAGRIIGASKTARDITDRKRMERQIQDQARDLVDANRRKDEFLAMLSHELRGPMAPMLSALALLRRQRGATQSQQDACDVIERQVHHVARLVDDLLDVSRISTGRVHLHPERVRINRILDHAVERARPLIEERGQHLTLSPAEDAPSLTADAARLEQVIGNLLHNASKYNRDGGHIALGAAQRGRRMVIEVSDDGDGMTPDTLAHVFDLFVQADCTLARTQGGMGIGLALVKRLVDLHGGGIEAHSDGIGRGSVFTVTLPLDAEAPGTETPGAEAPRAAPPAETAKASGGTSGEAAEGVSGETSRGAGGASGGGGLRVLVVDDSVDAARMSEMLLRAWGHTVRIAHDGPTALQLAEDFQPQVVLLDIGLPDMNGYEVARQMRLTPQVQGARIVAVTGYGQDADREKSKAAGCDLHLVKPVETDRLEALLAGFAAPKM